MSEIDSLEIVIQSTADETSKSIDTLTRKISGLEKSLGFMDKINFSGLSSLTAGSKEIAHLDLSGLDKLTSSVQQLGRKNALAGAENFRNLGDAINEFQQKINGTSIDFDMTPLDQLSSSISRLGGKAAQAAIPRISELTTALHNMVDEMSTFPAISQDLIDMTNALAKFARTGASGGKAAAELQGKLKGFSDSAKTATISAKSLAAAAGKLALVFGGFAGVAKMIKESVSLASDLTETQNMVDTSFGQYASKVEAFSKSSIFEYGISELQAKEISGRFQAIGQAAGFSQGKMSDMSLQLTALAADMGSFYNVSAEDTARSLQAIFTGESEPLRKYGIDLTNATLQQYALSQGIKKTVSEMSQQEKTLLRYNYVLASTESIQGDFQRTNDSWSNQTRMLSQNFKELGAVIGEVFINTLLPIVKKLNEIIQYTTAFAKAVRNSMAIAFGWEDDSGSAGIVLDDFTLGMDDFSDSLSTAAKNAKKLTGAIRAFDELKVISNPDSDSSVGVDFSGLENSFSGIQNAATNLKDEVGSSFYEIANKAEAFQKKVEKALEPIAVAIAKVFGETEIEHSAPTDSNATVNDFIEMLEEKGIPEGGFKLKLNLGESEVQIEEEEKTSFWGEVLKKLLPEEDLEIPKIGRIGATVGQGVFGEVNVDEEEKTSFWNKVFQKLFPDGDQPIPETGGIGFKIGQQIFGETEEGYNSGDFNPFSTLQGIFSKYNNGGTTAGEAGGIGFGIGEAAFANTEAGYESGDFNPFETLQKIFAEHGNGGTTAGEAGGVGFEIGQKVFGNAEEGFKSGSFDPFEALRQTFNKRRHKTTAGKAGETGYEVGQQAFENTKSGYEAQDFNPFGTLKKIFKDHQEKPEAAEIGFGIAQKILGDTEAKMAASELEFSTENLASGMAEVGLGLGKVLGINTKDGYGNRMNIVDVSKITGIKSFKTSAISKMGEIGIALGNKMATKTGTGFGEKKDDIKTKIENASSQAASAAKKSASLLEDFAKIGKTLGDKIASGILSKKTDIQNAIQNAVSGSADIGFNIAANVMNNYNTSTYGIERSSAESFNSRMRSAMSPLAETANGISGAVSSQMGSLAIQSPEGFGDGMKGVSPAVFSSKSLELAPPPDLGFSQKYYSADNSGIFGYGTGSDLSQMEKALYNAVYNATASAMKNNQGNGTTVRIEGDKDKLFKIIQEKDKENYMRTRNPSFMM